MEGMHLLSPVGGRQLVEMRFNNRSEPLTPWATEVFLDFMPAPC